MVDGIRSGGIQQTRGVGAGASLPGALTIPSVLVSQSGAVARKDGDQGKPLIPGFSGELDKLVLTSLHPHGSKGVREFPIDAQGRLVPQLGQPLTQGPFRLEIVAKDGTRFEATFDTSPKKTGVSHQGYDELKNLRLQRVEVAPPPPALPDEVVVPAFLLSQSGQPAMREQDLRKPLVPGFEGQLTALVVEQERNGLKSTRRFDIRDDGTMNPFGNGSPLGHGPFTVALEHASGARFTAAVDVSPKKTGVSHQGYETITGLRLARETKPASSDAHLADVAADFAKTGGATKAAPTLATSPLGVFFQNRS